MANLIGKERENFLPAADEGVTLSVEKIDAFMEDLTQKGRVAGTVDWYRRGLSQLYRALTIAVGRRLRGKNSQSVYDGGQQLFAVLRRAGSANHQSAESGDGKTAAAKPKGISASFEKCKRFGAF